MRRETEFQPLEARVAELNRAHAGADPVEVLARVLADHPGRAATVSSFGAESVVLLHLLAQVDRAAPVLFLDTEMLFPATLTYQREVAGRLGLTGVQVIRPTGPPPSRATRTATSTAATPTSAARSARPSRSTRRCAATRPGSRAASATRRRSARRSTSSRRTRRGGSRSTRSPRGARPTSTPTSTATGCPGTRWCARASPPSAAPPARRGWRRARTRAPGAGAGATRTNAASTS
jgi:hypothetical protein